jgi:transposase
MILRAHQCRGVREIQFHETSSYPTELTQLRAENAQLRLRIAELELQIVDLKRMLFGHTAERMPPVNRLLRKRRQGESTSGTESAKTKAARHQQAQQKKTLPTERVPHPVPESELHCANCGGAFRNLGEGEISEEYEYVPGRIVRRVHVREKRVCRCGATIKTAPAPTRVADGVQYGPMLHAHVITAKCADSMPLYRLAKRLLRDGVPISDSTLGDIFHRSAAALKVLVQAAIDEIRDSGYVNADETPIWVQAKGTCRKAYMWTFIGAGHVAYVFSPSRSAKTPATILDDAHGFLQVDDYSGYNPVCTPETMTRVGCLAHVRRYFFKAVKTAPEAAQYAMEQILGLYEVEYDAAEKQILGTAKHLRLRQRRSRAIMDSWRKWLEEEKPKHTPESPMGKAINYTLSNWPSLSVFLSDAKLRLDNNLSEGQLRIIALGRKNFLFVGNDQAGENLAVLQSLVSSCLFNNVNPQAYLADVLIRIQTHPASQIRQLLPKNWKTFIESAPP